MLGFGPNSPEYEARLQKPFSPPTVTLKQIHDAIPKHLMKKSPFKATMYVLRDITFTLTLFRFAYSISPWAATDFGGYISNYYAKLLVQTTLWTTYWWVQGLVWAGIFCLGHDGGHGTLYNSTKVNNTVGFVLHSFLLIPYYAWRSTHHAHHKATGWIEKDENYVPYERSDFGLPPPDQATAFDYHEVFAETPIYTLARMLIMQGFGWWIYLAKNTMGSKMYPAGTNHFDPDSPLFKKEQRDSIVWSNIGLGVQLTILFGIVGWKTVAWYYLVPYLLTNHWIVMFTYLHHSDPTIPHYRGKAWSFLRGAAATVDRPLMGWMGRFFFHNISHDHVAHHFFIKAPFYNGPEITKRLRIVLGEDYNYDSTPSFSALYRSFTQCLFIESDGDILFYKNSEGQAVREVSKEYIESATRPGDEAKDIEERKKEDWVPEDEAIVGVGAKLD